MKRRWEEDDRLADRALYALIMLLGVLVRSVSRRMSSAIAGFLGDFGYFILKVRRQIVTNNLALTFPEKSASAIGAIARQVYRNQAENFIEMLRLPMITSAEDAARLIDVDGRHVLARTRDQKKGGVLVSAHFGNWELLGMCTGLLMSPLSIVVKPLKNHAVDSMINAWRTMHGNRIIYDAQALREGLRALHKGEILTILGDQSDPGGSFYAEFLGRRTSVFLGPAYFALKAGVPLFVGMCRRIGDGRYIVESEEIDMSGLGTAKTDAEELTRRYTKVLERFIYQYPEEWFWLHNRWKRNE
ncbi:MAG: lysophospholipid acyltransferase family protein [Chlorobium sp.]|nr:MAG: lysophospholipid acyltransferase family protein [Chlorobium sp.]